MEVGLSSGDLMLDGDPAPPPQKGAEPPPQFSAHVYRGQTAGWIKMALGTEVGLEPCHIVLDGDIAPLPEHRKFSPRSLVKPLSLLNETKEAAITLHLLYKC